MTKCIIEESIVKKLSQLGYKIKFNDDSTTVNEASSTSMGQKTSSSYRSKELQNLSSCCNLYYDFLSGKILSEKMLLGLATNIVQIRGGAAKFKSTLSSNPYFSVIAWAVIHEKAKI